MPKYCKFGPFCKNKKYCTFIHPKYKVKNVAKSKKGIWCGWGPECNKKDKGCRFIHPEYVECPYGENCSLKNDLCQYYHPILLDNTNDSHKNEHNDEHNDRLDDESDKSDKYNNDNTNYQHSCIDDRNESFNYDKSKLVRDASGFMVIIGKNGNKIRQARSRIK